MRDHGNFTVSENECFRLVRFFDCDEDGRLSFQDFLSMFLPCEDNLLRNVTLDRPSFRVGRYDSLPRDIEFGMLEVIDKELDLMRTQDVLRRELEVRYDYTLGAAFRSIDRYNDGRIDVHNLGAFLRSCGHYATERELLSIVRRIDTDGDARIAFAEFSEFVGPACGTIIEDVKRGSSVNRGSRGSPLRDPMPPQKRGRAKSVAARSVMKTPKKVSIAQ
jgi:Ca2+-binding EF-hand superfamily protein